MTLHALGIAAAGGAALLRRLDAISANLANADTVGARRARLTSDQVLDTIFESGTLEVTQRDLDLAVEGEGFFRVRLPDGSPAFTRAGNLTKTADGLLATADGLVLDPPVQVPPFLSTLTIDPDGLVRGLDPRSPGQPMPVGQIELSRFSNVSGLQSLGGALFRATDAAGDQIDGRPGEGFGTIRQGVLEQSNIDPMRELMDLFHTQRAFELNNQVIQAADDILQSINTLRRKP
ncbi:MAG TPA: flagellar hook-basal body complex protein [Planctomycetota bacterium]|nr:flagellar hook-basal body complex protein [Planctomycetota bacterium]